jgi:hypothetical protein
MLSLLYMIDTQNIMGEINSLFTSLPENNEDQE